VQKKVAGYLAGPIIICQGGAIRPSVKFNVKERRKTITSAASKKRWLSKYYMNTVSGRKQRKGKPDLTARNNLKFREKGMSGKKIPSGISCGDIKDVRDFNQRFRDRSSVSDTEKGGRVRIKRAIANCEEA